MKLYEQAEKTLKSREDQEEDDIPF